METQLHPRRRQSFRNFNFIAGWTQYKETQVRSWTASYNGSPLEPLCERCVAMLAHSPHDRDVQFTSEHPKSTVATCALCMILLRKFPELLEGATTYLSVRPSYTITHWRYHKSERIWEEMTNSWPFQYFTEDKLFWPPLPPSNSTAKAVPAPEIPVTSLGHNTSAVTKLFRNCLSHSHRSTKPLARPSRLLDLEALFPENSPREIVLVDGAECCSPYVALSYCWGKRTFAKLLEDSLQDYHKAIQMAELPPLFRVAVVLNRALGVRFLWIDALCIIQPDSDGGTDWSMEVMKMQDIFAGCAFALSATEGRDPYDVFYSWPSHEFVRIDRSAENLGHGCTDLCIGWNTQHRDLEFLLNRGAINTRGWTLQERFLAPAVLHISKGNMVWECGQGLYDCHGCVQEVSYDKPEVKFIDGVYSGYDQTAGRELWRSLLENYCRRHLTKLEDRLPAIAGIAQYFAEAMNSRYYAGLMSVDLPGALLFEYERAAPGQRARARVDTKSPTWSWARFEGTVNCNTSRRQIEHPYFASKFRLQTRDVMVNAVNGPYGNVNGGRLLVTGFIAAASTAFLNLRSPALYVRLDPVVDGSTPSFQFGVYLLLVDASFTQGMGALGQSGPTPGQVRICFLLIKPLDMRQVLWERVGLFKRDVSVHHSKEQKHWEDEQDWDEIMLNWTKGFDHPVNDIGSWERRDLTIV